MDVSNTSASNLQGIDLFNELTEIDAENCSALSSVDLSQNPEITDLNLAGTAVSSLNVSSLASLETLDITGTDI